MFPSKYILFCVLISNIINPAYTIVYRSIRINERFTNFQIVTTPKTSAIECVLFCEITTGCNGAAFISVSESCTLYSMCPIPRCGSYESSFGTTTFCIEGEGHEDCKSLQEGGYTEDGVYNIKAFLPCDQPPVKAYCDMTSEGGGWTVFQRRFDGSVNFENDWTTYKEGFGDVNTEYWLGNENLHYLTSTPSSLMVRVKDFGDIWKHALYSSFVIGSESTNYRMDVSGYSGTAGDSFGGRGGGYIHNGMAFSTKDRDNDHNGGAHCAVDYKGAWWYNACHQSNLNGLYCGNIVWFTCNTWFSYNNKDEGMEKSLMMVRRN